MQINRTIRYAIRVVISLAESDKPVFQKEIAEKHQLSVKFLDYIIKTLKTHKIIKNFKGKSSGYVLAKPATEISVYDIFMAFDSLLEINCLDDATSCFMSPNCKARCFWMEFRNEIIKYLKSRNIHDILTYKTFDL